MLINQLLVVKKLCYQKKQEKSKENNRKSMKLLISAGEKFLKKIVVFEKDQIDFEMS